MNYQERKTLVVARRVRLGDIADEVGCSQAVVSRVLHGLTRRDTDFARKVRAAIARRVDKSVEDLWPEPDTAGAAA